VGAPLVSKSKVFATKEGTGAGLDFKPSTSKRMSPGKYPAQNDGTLNLL